jgi:hypothetical protein
MCSKQSKDQYETEPPFWNGGLKFVNVDTSWKARRKKKVRSGEEILIYKGRVGARAHRRGANMFDSQ